MEISSLNSNEQQMSYYRQMQGQQDTAGYHMSRWRSDGEIFDDNLVSKRQSVSLHGFSLHL